MKATKPTSKKTPDPPLRVRVKALEAVVMRIAAKIGLKAR